MHNPTLAPYAKEGECELRITAKAPTLEEAQSMLDPVEAQLRQRFGDLIYGVDVASLEQRVSQLLHEQQLTLSAAESCTGGLAAKRITDLSGASQIFKGGVVCYTNEVKHNLLGVPQEILDTYGAVSAETARAVSAFLRELPEEARNIFLRRYWYCDATADIARRYRVSESKVRVTLHRTRQKLKVYLEKEGVVL